MRYARHCVRRLGLHVCGISPAQTVDVEGVGRIDLCARHAVEYAGLAKHDEPEPTAKTKPWSKQEKRQPKLLGTTGEIILRWVAEHPDRTTREIAAAIGISYPNVGKWCVLLVRRGYLVAIHDKRSSVNRYRIMGPELAPLLTDRPPRPG